MTRILVIEDAKDLREDVIEMLLLEGFEVFGAENGLIGLQAAHHIRPDLIVCDVMMPELDGYGVLESMRSDPDIATTPFIFLTARAERDSVRHGMLLGADDYVTKPFTVHDLLGSIRTQLEKRRELDDRIQRHVDQISTALVKALPHELRTPLNSILGFSELLMHDAASLTPEQVVLWSNHINSAAQRLYHLVENYLYYARMQTMIGHAVELQEPVSNFHNVATINAERLSMKYRRVDDLVLDLRPAPVIAMNYVDAMKLPSELIDNAFKFSAPGQPVEVSGWVDGNYYVLSVSDRGRGIHPDHLKQIGAFMQFDRGMYEQQGLGFGLAITQLLATLYRTEVIIDSEIDHGTNVRFLLPLR